jgi:hypothetical protein
MIKRERLIFLFLAAVLAGIGGSLRAEDIYVELHLSPDGVYGVDSSGEEWEYDFSEERFVPESSATQRTQTAFRSDIEDDLRKETERVKAQAKMLKEETKAQVEELLEIRRIKGLQLGKVEIDADERVDGSVVAVGPVVVKGIVDGDVISYRRITVTSTGEINGDARAPEIVKMRGGIIKGRRYETDLPQIPNLDLFEEISYAGLIAALVIFVVLLLAGFIGVAIAPRQMNRVRDCIRKHFLKSFIVGFGVWLAVAPAFAFLCLTIIGIPVAIFALPLALILAIILGILALSQSVGEKVDEMLGGRYKSQLLHFMSGLIIIYIAWVLAAVFSVTPSKAADAMGTLFLVLAIIFWSIGATAGLGAILLTRYGTRDCDKALEVSIKLDVSPPPPPTPPPLKSE